MMFKKFSRGLAGSTLLVWMMLGGCSSTASESRSEAQTAPQLDAVCKDPRSPICTMEYKPVCALKDTGVRCVTTPCPSSEWQTYPNACTACSHPEVTGYVDGKCKTDDEAK
jgi:hypothetical protein